MMVLGSPTDGMENQRKQRTCLPTSSSSASAETFCFRIRSFLSLASLGGQKLSSFRGNWQSAQLRQTEHGNKDNHYPTISLRFTTCNMPPKTCPFVGTLQLRLRQIVVGIDFCFRQLTLVPCSPLNGTRSGTQRSALSEQIKIRVKPLVSCINPQNLE